jgi:hypothetical protein
MQNTLLAIAKSMVHFNYNKRLVQDQNHDFLSAFTVNWDESTYTGSPFQPLHDFSYEALLTLSRENNLPYLRECIIDKEVTRLDWKTGIMQILFEPTFKGKFEGYTHVLTSVYYDFPTSMISCAWAAYLENVSIATFLANFKDSEFFW